MKSFCVLFDLDPPGTFGLGCGHGSLDFNFFQQPLTNGIGCPLAVACTDSSLRGVQVHQVFPRERGLPIRQLGHGQPPQP